MAAASDARPPEEARARMRTARLAVTIAALALVPPGCRSASVAPGEAQGQQTVAWAPPTGQAPWLAPPGPGWVLIVPEVANSTVLLFEPSLQGEGEERSALVLINFIRPLQRVGGRFVRSEVARIEADCAARAYRLLGRRLHETHGGTGEPIGAVAPDLAAPMRPVQPGSLAEDVVARLCDARATDRGAVPAGGAG